ncbi:MAG TPA: 2'-5' RNA ligase family protein [Nocardioides sp.]|nr:2'-5' RNA ligase family protein [Nocardioides sp.]
MGHSVLAVPVPDLEGFVRARWEHYDPSWVSADPSFTHAHITVLAPFLEEPADRDLALLAALATRTPAFDFALEDVAAFANGIIHLPPVPDEPFARLTREVRAAYPTLLPYAGEFDPVPHLTLDHTTAEISPATVARALDGTLPAHCRAKRLELHRYAEGDCRVLASWPLGG